MQAAQGMKPKGEGERRRADGRLSRGIAKKSSMENDWTSCRWENV